MMKTFILTGDLNAGDEFHITDGEGFDAMVKEPFEALETITMMGYRLLAVLPTSYHYENGKMSLFESVWIFMKIAGC